MIKIRPGLQGGPRRSITGVLIGRGDEDTRRDVRGLGAPEGRPREDAVKRQPRVQASDRGLGRSRPPAPIPDLQPLARRPRPRTRLSTVATATCSSRPDSGLVPAERRDAHTPLDICEELENVGLPWPRSKTSLSILASKSACGSHGTLTCRLNRGVQFAR